MRSKRAPLPSRPVSSQTAASTAAATAALNGAVSLVTSVIPATIRALLEKLQGGRPVLYGQDVPQTAASGRGDAAEDRGACAAVRWRAPACCRAATWARSPCACRGPAG